VVVGVRAVEPGATTVKAGALASLPRPIAGIDEVSNPGDLVLRQREETDEELRARARRLVRPPPAPSPHSKRPPAAWASARCR
jgi:uncharacterized phage protein gp47/JayE